MMLTLFKGSPAQPDLGRVLTEVVGGDRGLVSGCELQGDATEVLMPADLQTPVGVHDVRNVIVPIRKSPRLRGCVGRHVGESCREVDPCQPAHKNRYVTENE